MIKWTPTGRAQAALVVVGLLMCLWVGFMAWRLVTAPQRAATAQAGQVQAEARAAAGADAVAVTANRSAAESVTDTTARNNADAIRQAPGADAPIDPALAAAGRRGLCQYATYRDRPECLLKPHP